jgi:polyferredoxin
MGSTLSWHHLRKRIHLLCFLIFFAQPFLNIMRFDIPRQRFYFAGVELWINEFAIVFFALMFLMFLIVVSSVFYGRVYCGYLCPQMIFSEASLNFESRLKRWVTKKFISWSPQARTWLHRVLFQGIVAIVSVFLAFIFICYFVSPRDVLHSVLTFDIRTAAGISGVAVTLITFLDFSLLRLRFCATVCPYGYLQGMLGDRNTLLVHYRDDAHACIECKKCVRVCPMGIDIRKSPFQIECVHCAECIDACGEVMTKVRKPNLIHYVWGESGPLAAGTRQPWDARRIIVLLVLLGYASGLTTALALRRPVLVHVMPERAKLYRIGDDGRIYNQFRYTIANRGSKPASVAFSTRDLPGASLSLTPNPVTVQPGASMQGMFEIAESPGQLHEMVTHFRIVTGSDTIPMTFLAPEGK